jgi:hypothetical protein
MLLRSGYWVVAALPNKLHWATQLILLLLLLIHALNLQTLFFYFPPNNAKLKSVPRVDCAFVFRLTKHAPYDLFELCKSAIKFVISALDLHSPWS